MEENKKDLIKEIGEALNTEAVIKKNGSQYCIYSKTGKNLGCFDTREEALKRLGEIEYFKHNKGE